VTRERRFMDDFRVTSACETPGEFLDSGTACPLEILKAKR
jgi:hypothetical protein